LHNLAVSKLAADKGVGSILFDQLLSVAQSFNYEILGCFLYKIQRDFGRNLGFRPYQRKSVQAMSYEL